jgi:hypothetical protein
MMKIALTLHYIVASTDPVNATLKTVAKMQNAARPTTVAMTPVTPATYLHLKVEVSERNVQKKTNVMLITIVNPSQ